MLFFLTVVLLIVAEFGNCLRSMRSKMNVLMTLKGRTAFLTDKQEIYSRNCLRLSIDGCKAALKNNIELIEVEFPAMLKNDISVIETLDTNRVWVREFAKAFESLGKDLWVVFPDTKEASLAVKTKEWSGMLPFTITSISRELETAAPGQPKLMIAINPGFNVEEWIQLPQIRRGSPIIVVNGNLDRLRNGYYPALFYPGLAKVSKDFYSKFTQAFFINPVAIGGDRFAAWLTKVYPGDWELLVKRATSTRSSASEYDVLFTSEEYPDQKFIWATAKDKYTKDRGLNTFWGI